MKESYTSASTFPVKLFHQKVIEKGKIIPIHLHLSPTNKCNLSCPFCSCKDVDRNLELTFEQITWILDVYAPRGTKALTITGGGEPLVHPALDQIIEYAAKKEIEVGMVTNGDLLNKLKHHENLTWCRISSSDYHSPNYKIIEKALKVNPKTDWGFSRVITRNPDYKSIERLIGFANDHDFTHVRLVSDLCDLSNIPSVKGKIKANDQKVIYQERKDFTKGSKKCYISLLKPTITPEGLFPCCGAQYAITGQPNTMIDLMKMGDIKDLPEILDKQKYFNGSICDVCYYSQYNKVLENLLSLPKHLAFV